MIDIKTMFADYNDCYLSVNKYMADNSVAIQAWNEEDGPIATLTVCLDDKGLGENEAYVDTNNCPWVMDLIERNGLGEPTGDMRASGYCIYPKVKFDMDEVMKHEYKEAG